MSPRTEETGQDTPCGVSCWHENYLTCTLPTGHSGDHVAHGTRYPGAPITGPQICTWKRTR